MPLLSVLWTIALLTIVAAVTQSSGIVSYTLMRNTAEITRQEALAEAALNLAVLALLDQRPGKRPGVDGKPWAVTFDGVEIKVTIQDELGRIDLNHADAPLLARLFRASGVKAQEADTLADRIIDWRDPDDLRRLSGAESADYREAGIPGRPRSAPFRTIEEVRLVLGLTSELFERIGPAVTIYSGKPTIDPNLAPGLARDALLGREHHLAGSTRRGHGRGQSMVLSSVSLNGRSFLIRITFMMGATQVLREAVVRLTGDPSKLYWIFSLR